MISRYTSVVWPVLHFKQSFPTASSSSVASFSSVLNLTFQANSGISYSVPILLFSYCHVSSQHPKEQPDLTRRDRRDEQGEIGILSNWTLALFAGDQNEQQYSSPPCTHVRDRASPLNYRRTVPFEIVEARGMFPVIEIESYLIKKMQTPIIHQPPSNDSSARSPFICRSGFSLPAHMGQ